MTRALFTPIKDLIALWRLYRALRREAPAIVHTHTLKAGILGRVAAKLARVPVVIHTFHGFGFYVHNHGWKRRFFVCLERVAAICSDLILSVNKEDIATARSERIGTRTPIKWLGPGGVGIDLERFNPERVGSYGRREMLKSLGLSEEHNVVGFVGRLFKGKGICDLFRAMHVLREVYPSARLLVIGPVDTGRSDAVMPSSVEADRIRDITVFTGFRDDLPELYAAMDVFVLPSHNEGLPLAVMEASAMGVPCVVTDVRGCREVVVHRCTGLIVPQGDIAALASAIWEVLQDPEEAKRLGYGARRLALERFDERAVFEKVKRQYADLLEYRGVVAPRPLRSPILNPANW